jgi:hypothetical protein
MCAYSLLKLLFSPACTAGIFISVPAPLHIKVNIKHGVNIQHHQEVDITNFIGYVNKKILSFMKTIITVLYIFLFSILK